MISFGVCFSLSLSLSLSLSFPLPLPLFSFRQSFVERTSINERKSSESATPTEWINRQSGVRRVSHAHLHISALVQQPASYQLSNSFVWTLSDPEGPAESNNPADVCVSKWKVSSVFESETADVSSPLFQLELSKIAPWNYVNSSMVAPLSGCWLFQPSSLVGVSNVDLNLVSIGSDWKQPGIPFLARIFLSGFVSSNRSSFLWSSIIFHHNFCKLQDKLDKYIILIKMCPWLCSSFSQPQWITILK